MLYTKKFYLKFKFLISATSLLLDSGVEGLGQLLRCSSSVVVLRDFLVAVTIVHDAIR